MNNNIFPCLWFDGQAKQAAEFYCSIFENSRITTDTPMVVQFELEGKKIMGLNGGPQFKINPAISFFVTCSSREEMEKYYGKLMQDGKAMMPLDKYPWSEYYAWVSDQFGTSWQLMLGVLPEGRQKIVTSFLFVGGQCGKAAQAIQLYTSIFPGSGVTQQEFYQEGQAQPAGNLMFGEFSLNGEVFTAMDGTGNHDFQFNEGFSIMVQCDNQEEIDHYWSKLTEGGEESRCGWLKDKFGVSWQITPKVLFRLFSDPEKGQRAMAEMMKMKKFDIQALVDA